MVFPKNNSVGLFHALIVCFFTTQQDLHPPSGRSFLLYEVRTDHDLFKWLQPYQNKSVFKEWKIPRDVVSLNAFYEECPTIYIDDVYYVLNR